jgi:tetratricopeptide (TPR) repeat protein
MREVGDREGESLALANIAYILYFQRQESGAAYPYCQDALALAREIGNRYAEATALTIFGHILLALAHYETAQENYTEALALRRQLGQRSLVQQPLAGLARVALEQGNLPQALSYVEELLAFFAAGQEPDRTVDPFSTFLTCYDVLAAAADPRAGSFLQSSYEALQARANQFTDAAVRRSFLENVPVHRALVDAWNDCLALVSISSC